MVRRKVAALSLMISFTSAADTDSATSGCVRNVELCRAAAGEESVLCPPVCAVPRPIPTPRQLRETTTKPSQDLSAPEPVEDAGPRKTQPPQKDPTVSPKPQPLPKPAPAPKPQSRPARPKPIALPEDGDCWLKDSGGKATQDSPRWCFYVCVDFPEPIIITLDPPMDRCPGGKLGTGVKWANIRGFRRLSP